MTKQHAKKSIRIFISHSSKDYDLAQALIQLLKSALKLSAEEIRCTSVVGYKLPAGARVSGQIKTEVHESEALIALISPNALVSTYFQFELGARWGAGLPLYPLFAGGTNATNVNDWLRDINALNCHSEGEMVQLVKDLAVALRLEPDSPDSYLSLAKGVVTASKRVESKYIESYGQLDPKEQQLQQANMKNEDGALGDEYSSFWNIVRKYYFEIYRQTKPGCPETLEELVGPAGAPPNTDKVELLAWPILNESELRPEQRLIWEFAKSIYPARRPEDTGDVWEYCAIKPIEDAKRFHDARRALSKYWDKWPPLVGFEFIYERYMTRRAIILVLAWLELALVQWTRMRGMHKQELFKLALKFDKIFS